MEDGRYLAGCSREETSSQGVGLMADVTSCYPITSFAANRMAIDSRALSKDILQSPCESAEMSKHGEKIRCWSLVGSSRIERAAVRWLPRARQGWRGQI